MSSTISIVIPGACSQGCAFADAEAIAKGGGDPDTAPPELPFWSHADPGSKTAPDILFIPVHKPALNTTAGISTGSACGETGRDDRIRHGCRGRRDTISLPPLPIDAAEAANIAILSFEA